MQFPSAHQLGLLKTTLFLLGLLPLLHLLLGLWQGSLGANPIEYVTRDLGTWALNFLLITLSITPLRHASGWHWLLRMRRMLGLYAFFYACLHLLCYLWLDQFFDWREIWNDILKRPFITVGMLTFALLIPLAATSNAAMIHRLGGRRWQRLHRLTYPLAILAVLHYLWLVKLDLARPLAYAGILAVLLLNRALRWQRTRPSVSATGNHRGCSPTSPARPGVLTSGRNSL